MEARGTRSRFRRRGGRSRARRKPRRREREKTVTRRDEEKRRCPPAWLDARARSDARRTPLVSPCDPPPLWGDPTVFFPWKCGVMSTGLGDPGSSEGSPRCTESLEKASCTSSGSASASAPATANPTVRLIGCAMAIAWPDLGEDRRSASGRMRRSVFASRETFWRVRGGETWTSSRYDFLRVRHHNTEPDDRLSRKKRFVSCTACVFLYASRRSNAMIPYPFQRRIVDIASDQGIQTEGLCPRRAVSISRVSVSL
jgi:hypothetical protein